MTGVQTCALPIFAGSVAFKLYDTFGFPVDLTADLCRERGVALDAEGFESEMERQRAQSREAWKGGEAGVSDAAAAELARTGVSVEFVGYDRLEAAARVVAAGQPAPQMFTGDDGWRRVIDAPIDLAYIATPWDTHTPYAAAAMEAEIGRAHV